MIWALFVFATLREFRILRSFNGFSIDRSARLSQVNQENLALIGCANVFAKPSV